ncbi:hypothetical protein [Pelomonas sp. BJYL3]|uniref:hypothetical protein n=1 Tax=Pelomonas sp. BJYL3 TaxID=2976697 RepID=UPI0022B46324|nr:hypothetical protein [Pelomonas sp. BJYL3]
MRKPILNKPYTPSASTDIRATFQLERQRLAKAAADREAEDFGMALGVALIRTARYLRAVLGQRTGQ